MMQVTGTKGVGTSRSPGKRLELKRRERQHHREEDQRGGGARPNFSSPCSCWAFHLYRPIRVSFVYSLSPPSLTIVLNSKNGMNPCFLGFDLSFKN